MAIAESGEPAWPVRLARTSDRASFALPGSRERYRIRAAMSRVVYTETKDTEHQEALRIAHQVRLVAPIEEGNSVSHLPGGVYGYTYSPGLSGAPLFAVRRYRSYETHKLPSGDVFVIGF